MSARSSAHGVVAESVLTVAFALQLVAAVVLIISSVILVLGALAGAILGLGAFAVFGIVGLVIGVLTALLLAVAYYRSYAPARRGEYAQARSATLFLGIVFLVLIVTAVIGVLYILAYGRLSDTTLQTGGDAAPASAAGSAAGSARFSAAPTNREGTYPHQSWVRCLNCGLPVVWPAQTCPRCTANVASQYVSKAPGQKSWVRCTGCGLPVEWPTTNCPRCSAYVSLQYAPQGLR